MWDFILFCFPYILLAKLFPYNDGKVCTISTTTGLIHTDTFGGKLEALDGINCTEYKLSPNNDGSSGEIPLSVPFPIFQRAYNSLYVSKLYFWIWLHNIDCIIVI